MVSRNPRAGDLHPDCVAAVRSAAELCESLGHVVEDVSEQFKVAFDWNELITAQVTLFGTGLRSRIQQSLADLGKELHKGDVEPGTFDFLTNKKYEYTGVDVARALRVSALASHQLASFMRDYPVLLTSTLGKPPIEHGVLTTQKEQVDIDEIVAFIPITFLANFTGVPAMSVPLHWNESQLPIGVHFFGRYGDEATLLRLAGQLEQAKPWRQRRPPETNLMN